MGMAVKTALIIVILPPREQFPFSTYQHFLHLINKQSPEHFLKTANRKRQPKVSERRSVDRAIENLREEVCGYGN